MKPGGKTEMFASFVVARDGYDGGVGDDEKMETFGKSTCIVVWGVGMDANDGGGGKVECIVLEVVGMDGDDGFL